VKEEDNVFKEFGRIVDEDLKKHGEMDEEGIVSIKGVGGKVAITRRKALLDMGEEEKKEWKRKYEKQKYNLDEVKIKLGLIYEEIIIVLKKFCDIKEEYYPLVAMWIIGTYIHDEFETFPYLFFNAMRGSGKSRILKLIAELSHNGELLGSMSEATLFRTAKGRTLCIDEFEKVGSQEKQGLRELLNSAYKKGSKIKRMKKLKEGYEVEEFEVYSSIVMANRCITIIIERSNKPEITKLMENFRKDDKIIKIKSDLLEIQCSLCGVVMSQNIENEWNNYILQKYTTTLNTYTTQTTTLLHTTPKEDFSLFNKMDEAGIDGRNLELSFPIFTIANLLNSFDSILETLKNIMTEKKLEDVTESKDIQVFDFVSRQEALNSFISMTKLTNEFRDFIGVEGKEEEWVNSRWLGRALKRLVLTKEKRRQSKGIEVILDVHKAQEKMVMFK